MIFLLTALIATNIPVTENAKVSMKIISSPLNQIENVPIGDDQRIPSLRDMNDWTKSVRPANYSGPPHLKQFIGHCFALMDQKYQYKFCPFQNFTQEEVNSGSLKKYKGVLGVWGEWQIDYDNKLLAMRYLQGDKCDDNLNRSSTIELRCKDDTFGELSDIKEPHKCQYEAVFSTQLVCHSHALLIYPWLPESARREWDEIYTSYKNEHIPSHDLRTSLNYLFVKCGLLLKPNTQLREAPSKAKPMSYLNTCDIQLIQLRAELQNLREENAKLVAEMKKLM